MKANFDLYPNFSKSEFDCKETGENEMEHSFMAKLQELRTAYGKSLVINSGFRSFKHSIEKRKPKKNGAHPTGKAADIKIDRKEAYKLLKLAIELGFTGIGFKQHGGGRFIHLDTIEDNPSQPRPTVWSYK